MLMALGRCFGLFSEGVISWDETGQCCHWRIIPIIIYLVKPVILITLKFFLLYRELAAYTSYLYNDVEMLQNTKKKIQKKNTKTFVLNLVYPTSDHPAPCPESVLGRTCQGPWRQVAAEASDHSGTLGTALGTGLPKRRRKRGPLRRQSAYHQTRPVKKKLKKIVIVKSC
jgi:hypothetical protein